MAERSLSTWKGWAKAAGLLAGQSGWLALDKAAMGGYTAATNALTTEASESGVARASATVSNVTTTQTNDTTRFYKSFSVLATVSITGAGVFSASTAGDMWAFHEWAASVPVVSGDTINETIDLQFEVGV